MRLHGFGKFFWLRRLDWGDTYWGWIIGAWFMRLWYHVNEAVFYFEESERSFNNTKMESDSIWFVVYLESCLRAGDAQQVRALTVFPEVLSSIPSSHMVAHNHPYHFLVCLKTGYLSICITINIYKVVWQL